MITISDLLARSMPLTAPPPESNPLADGDALHEAQLLDVRFDVVAGIAAILFELRMALQLHETNTGLLVAHGVHRLAWSGPERSTRRTAWTVGGSTVGSEPLLWRLELGLWPAPGAQLELVAAEAAFFAGDVPGIGEVPPNYVEDDDVTIRASLASWDSPIVVVNAVSSGSR